MVAACCSVQPPPRRLAADEPHALVAYEVVEHPHGVAASAHAGHHRGGQPPLFFEDLGPGLLADDALEIPDNHGERMRPHYRAQYIMGVRHPFGPLPHGLVDRVLKGHGAAGHRMHLGPQQLHAVDVQGLALGVLLAHENLAFQPQQGRRRGGGHAVLARAGFRDDPGFSHLLGQQRLSQHVVDFVGSGVVEILPLDVDLRPAQILRHLLRIIQQRRPSRVFLQQGVQLGVKVRIRLVMLVSLLQPEDLVHQGLGYVLASMYPVASFAHLLFVSFIL